MRKEKENIVILFAMENNPGLLGVGLILVGIRLDFGIRLNSDTFYNSFAKVACFDFEV